MPNFSLGSVLATRFAALAAPYFDSIEIVEAHHPGKVDSPSGTAIRTAELIGAARDGIGPVEAPHADQRARGQQVASVPIHSIRLDGVLAQQDVLFGGVGETLSIRHVTMSDASYEAGIMLGLRATRDAPRAHRRARLPARPRRCLMKVRAAVVVMGALLALYLLFAVYYGLLLIGTGEPIAVAIGVALLVLPAIAFGVMIAEFLFAVRAQRLGEAPRGGGRAAG